MKKNIQVISERCPQNHLCPAIKACPQGAISQDSSLAPHIDKLKCTDCGICLRYCPQGVFRN